MSTYLDMGIPEVGSGILQPKLKNRWRVTFANLGGGTDSTPVSMQAINVSRPKLSFQEVELHRYNSRAWIGSKHNWEPMSLTVEDDVTNTATNVIQEQLQKQQWLIGAEGTWLAAAATASAYKFTVYADLLDGNEQILEKWTYEGCWITNCDWGELGYADGDAVTITLSLRYDHARQDISFNTSNLGTALGS